MKTFLPLIATIVGVISQSGYYAQGFKIIKNKSSRNVSLITFLLYSILLFLWIVYGVMISNAPIIICNVIGIIGCLIVVISYIAFRKQ